MKKILYLTTWDFSDGPSSGITQKIKAQIKTFVEEGFTVDYTYISNNETYFCKNNESIPIGKVGCLRKLAANYYLYKYLRKEKYSYVYNRYGLMDKYYYKILKALFQNKCKILVEMPTYPYDAERLPGIKWWLLYSIDKLYRKKAANYIDCIATYSRDETIFGVPTIKIVNGIDFDIIKAREPENSNGVVNLIAIAGFTRAHGYDRLLKGIGEYYCNGGDREILLHMVGDGEPMKEYRLLVEKYHIQKYCRFYGVKRGKEVNQIYNICDIGIESLACFRKNIYLSSSLKSREYAAKGIPFITACQSDVFENKMFVLKVPEDETPIDVEQVVKFYDKMYNHKERSLIVKEIREQARQCCDIKITMRPIIDYFIRNGEKA